METAASTVSPAPRRSAVGLAASASLLVLLVSWELVHPTLPVPFELALASRAPGAASWLCRLPMALSSIAGLVALYIFLTRTAERRAGVYAVAILATTPAWFVHGRMMTGAIVPMACAATVLAGLGVAMLDPHAKTTTRATGALAALLATLVAILSSRWGIPPRGLVPIVAVPTAAIALAALLSPRRSCASARLRPPDDRFRSSQEWMPCMRDTVAGC